MITLTRKCCYTVNAKSKPKFSCKVISKKLDPMFLEKLSTEALTKHNILDSDFLALE